MSADQAAIDGAQVQFSYATIAAPIDGRAGVRQVDPGNIVHVSHTNPLTILTLVHPVAVMFSLPQSKLFDVHEAMLRGPVREAENLVLPQQVNVLCRRTPKRPLHPPTLQSG